jgi:hypothetical protein
MSQDQKSALVQSIVTACTDDVVSSIIATLKGLSAGTENDRGGCGRGLANLWEEYKHQFQYEHTHFEDRYQRVVWPLCREAVGKLPVALQQLLWLETDDYDEHDIDQEHVTLADFDVSPVVTSIYQRLRDVANNEPLIFDPDQECSDDYPPGG